MYNQRNYHQFGQRLPPPVPHFQQAGPSPYRPPVSVPPTGTMTSGQSYLVPPPPPTQNPNWSQSQHPTPRMPLPYQQGQHFYRVPPPPLAPLPSSSYFSPSGSCAPPPPPPASPPPRPPPLPPSPASNSNIRDSGTSVIDTSEVNIKSDIPPPPPRDEKTVRKIEVLCQYIAKNGDEFEHMTCQKEIGNPEFEFLFGGAPGSQAAISHEYFKWMKKKCISTELLERERKTDLSHSPAGSDMDMEDDITQPEEQGIDKSFGIADRESEFISNEVDIKPTEGVDDNQCQVPTMTVGVVDSERSVDSKTEKYNIELNQEMNQSKESPFRLVQGYASDDSTENDNEPHFENVSPVNEHVFENLSPVAVSPQVKSSITLSVPVVEGSLNITSNIPEPSAKTENLDNGNDGDTSTEGNDITRRKNDGAQKENSNAKFEVDEFGRMVKEGIVESDSDDYNRRRSKRDRRSRSRTRYSHERRRRSPRRRRENRSRSRSRSPKKKNRSPYNRRNRNNFQEICHDFRLGRCFRGETCRYFHDTETNEESRRYKKSKHHLDPVSDRFQNSDKLVPEKDEVNNHGNRSDSVNKESVESPGHTADVASEHPATETVMPGGEPKLAGEYNIMPLPPPSLWNSLPPPPPPRPQLGGPMPQYQQNQPSFQTNYQFQPFVTPYGPQMNTYQGVYPMNYPILQQPLGPTTFSQDNFAQISSSPNLVSTNSRPVGPMSSSHDNFAQISSSSNLASSNSREPPPAGITQSFLQNPVADKISEYARSRISSHYNPYASTFDKPFGPSLDQNDTPGGDQYDPLFDSINPSSLKKSDNGTKEVAVTASEENDEFGETADAEVGAVENDSHSPSSPIDLRDMATGEIEIDQVKPKKSKDSRSMKLFKVSVADFVKEVLKPSWRQGSMSKEAFKTIVKKTVDKVSGAMKNHQVPKSQAKINHYIDSSQRKLTKLVMGYVDKYVKV